MSRGVDLSTLSALSDDATLAALATIASAEHNTHRSTRRSQINNLLLGMQDAESRYSGSGAPTDKPQGKIYFDTATSLWMGYKTASGTPVTILDSGALYTADLSTAGTATFRAGGPIEVNTTQVSRTTTGVLMTYTLPAGTLARDGQFVEVTCFGTRSGAVGTFSLQPRFDTTALTTHSAASTGITDWMIRFFIIRTGAATQDCGSYMILNTDADSSTTLCDFATATKTLSGALAIDVNLSAIAAGTVTQEIMVVRFGNK